MPSDKWLWSIAVGGVSFFIYSLYAGTHSKRFALTMKGVGEPGAPGAVTSGVPQTEWSAPRFPAPLPASVQAAEEALILARQKTGMLDLAEKQVASEAREKVITATGLRDKVAAQDARIAELTVLLQELAAMSVAKHKEIDVLRTSLKSQQQALKEEEHDAEVLLEVGMVNCSASGSDSVRNCQWVGFTVGEVRFRLPAVPPCQSSIAVDLLHTSSTLLACCRKRTLLGSVPRVPPVALAATWPGENSNLPTQ